MNLIWMFHNCFLNMYQVPKEKLQAHASIVILQIAHAKMRPMAMH